MGPARSCSSTSPSTVAKEWNTTGNCMLVVGATYPEELADIRTRVGDLPFLVPGVGAQGGDVAKVMAAGKTAAGTGLVISSSRAILYASSGEISRTRRARPRRNCATRINAHRALTRAQRYGPQRKIGGGTLSSGRAVWRRVDVGQKIRQLCVGCMSPQNSGQRPDGNRLLVFDRQQLALAFDDDGVLVGVGRAEDGAEFIRHHVLAHVANAQVERLRIAGFGFGTAGGGSGSRRGSRDGCTAARQRSGSAASAAAQAASATPSPTRFITKPPSLRVATLRGAA